MEDIDIIIGGAKLLQFTVERPKNTALNITGATVRWVMKDSHLDTAYLIEKLDADFDKTDEATGVVTAILTATETATLEAGEYKSELEVVLVADDDVIKDKYSVKVRNTLFHD